MKICQTKDFELIATLNKYVHEIHTTLYPEYFKEYHYEDSKNFFEGVVEKEIYIFLVLEDCEEALGYAWIELKNYPENAFKKPYRSVYVHQISIINDKRKKGYGSKLLEQIHAIAKENDIHKIELDYWVENEIAKNFYKKQEFVKTREFVYKDI